MTMTDEERNANFPNPQVMLDGLAKAGVSELDQLQALLSFETDAKCSVKMTMHRGVPAEVEARNA